MKNIIRILSLFLAFLCITACVSCAVDRSGEDAYSTTSEVTDLKDSETDNETTAEVTTDAATEPEATTAPEVGKSINGAKIMFVGNSFTYYGKCTIKGTENSTGGNSYFKLVAKSYGDSVTVFNFTYGDHKLSATEKGLYEKMLSLHPNYYNNPDEKAVDSFYLQDYVVLQQSGNDASNTYSACRNIKKLFPETTRFIYYVTTYAVHKNMTKYNIPAGEILRSRGEATYLPLGHLCCDLWNGKIKVEGSSVVYNKYSFVVNRNSSDGYHPNYLTGYITALMTYCLITGKSAVGADYSFVHKTMEYYTNGSSNYDKILSSETDMRGIQEYIDAYIKEYNP